jgi:hypothetical protein
MAEKGVFYAGRAKRRKVAVTLPQIQMNQP